MFKNRYNLLLTVLSLVSLVQSAPICGANDAQVNLAKKVKRKVVEVTRTVATVSATSYYYTTTHTVTAPLVEVVISGDLTYTVTLTSNVPTESQGQTITSIAASQESIASGLSSAVHASSSNNGGYVSSWSSDSFLIPSNSATVGASTPTQSISSMPTSTSTTKSDTTTLSSVTSSSSSSESSTSSSSESYTSSSSESSTSTSSSSSSSSSSTLKITSTTSSSTSSSSSSSNTSSSGSSSDSTSISTASSTSESVASTLDISVTSTLSSTFSSAVSTIIPTALAYSPYNDDGSCKDYDSVSSDLQKISDRSIPAIRVYGTDCNYLDTVLPIASSLGIKVNQGFWFSSTDLDPIQESAAALIAYVKTTTEGWDLFECITIGNEAINGGYMEASSLMTIITAIKKTLRNSGYNGLITTAEPPVSFEDNPELCSGDLLDFVAINPHSYFDASIDATQAGSFVVGQQKIVEDICPGKEVIISETGYPSSGDTNGLNVPSAENQKAAIKSILECTNGEVTILTMYNDMWKSPGSYNIEQYFGVYELLD
ncbi:putative glucan endo-1,3-beta-D-glucosidase [Saccharomycopsis crataegensis]|uniref:Glucan endo-1,3-beta-D-glucosidase n=1 Tax=Saccharomycopsis crataegensis TaxID=43959 RepID=A0AAV5QSG6_9ASCO|nr:putative glucan endo-1,3-beta-D-glucosidase [Saccharomycopsis crataegensis]